MAIKKTFLLIFTAFFISACSSSSFIKVGNLKYKPKPDNYEMPVLTGKFIKENHYKIIGRVFATKEIFFTEEETVVKVLEMLKKRAKKEGADAIIDAQFSKQFNREIQSFVIKGVADAIVFKMPKKNPGEKLPPKNGPAKHLEL